MEKEKGEWCLEKAQRRGCATEGPSAVLGLPLAGGGEPGIVRRPSG